jgi:hypothetical protein
VFQVDQSIDQSVPGRSKCSSQIKVFKVDQSVQNQISIFKVRAVFKVRPVFKVRSKYLRSMCQRTHGIISVLSVSTIQSI